MPVLLGTGLRFFDSSAKRFRLEKIGMQTIGQRVSLRFRVASLRPA
jgi:hypothetical protein